MKLSKDAKLIIFDRALGNVVEIFLSTFLAAYFYKITQDNLIYLSIYHMIAWAIATIGAFLVSDYIKRKNKLNLYRFGTFLKMLYIFLIIILKENIINYVWLIGICYGISVACTGFPFNMMESELVDINERTKYMGYRSAIGQIVKVVIPIVLGAYITFTSYQIAAILVLIFSTIKFINTFFIENKNVSKSRVHLLDFLKEINKHKEYPIKKLYLIEFLKGITVHGVLSIVISLLIIYEFNTELNLGLWTAAFSIAQIVTMIIFAKRYNKKKPNTILLICGVAISISFIWLLSSIDKTTIIIYNLIYYTFMEILLSITEIRLFDYSNEPPFNKEYNTEYFVFRELFLNIGRILGYFILLCVGLMHNMEYLKVLLFFTTVALILIILLTKNISKQEESKE